MDPLSEDDEVNLATRPDIELEADVVVELDGDDDLVVEIEVDTNGTAPAAIAADERRVRARRIRERSEELVEALGADHPLVAAALERADALDREADSPGRAHLR